MAKNNKYIYKKVIQQYYSAGYGWEDCAEYNPHDKTLIRHDLKEYRLMGYPTRVISRRTPNPHYNPNP